MGIESPTIPTAGEQPGNGRVANPPDPDPERDGPTPSLPVSRARAANRRDQQKLAQRTRRSA